MKSKVIRGTSAPIAPAKESHTTKHDKRETPRHADHHTASRPSTRSGMLISSAIVLLLIAFLSGLQYTQSTTRADAAHTFIAGIDSSVSSIESDLITAALYHTTQFNPEKRTAFYRALHAPDTGYESRVLAQWQKNLSDSETAATVRNDFMTGYMTARPEAAPKQETIANLLDAMDQQLHDKAEQMIAHDAAQRSARCWIWISRICAVLGALLLIVGLRHL